jgi:hypothetical protein
MVTLTEKQLETLLGLLREENSRTGKLNMLELWAAETDKGVCFEFYDPKTYVGRLRGRLDLEGDFPA